MVDAPIKGQEASSVWVETRVTDRYTYRQLCDLVEKLSPLRGDNKTRILFLANIEEKAWKGPYPEPALSFAGMLNNLQKLAEKAIDHCVAMPVDYDQLRRLLANRQDLEGELAGFWSQMPHKELHGDVGEHRLVQCLGVDRLPVRWRGHFLGAFACDKDDGAIHG